MVAKVILERCSSVCGKETLSLSAKSLTMAHAAESFKGLGMVEVPDSDPC